MQRFLFVTALILAVVQPTAWAQTEVPQELLEEYWECMERYDLKGIREILWSHQNVESIDASLYGLPRDDFDDISLLTIQERLDFREIRAGQGIEMATSGPHQYPHHLRRSLDHHYEVTGSRPNCASILGEAGDGDGMIENLASGWASDLNLTDALGGSRGEVNIAIDFANPNRIIATSVASGGAETSDFRAVSTDWGQTWATGQVGNNAGSAWECDPVSYYQTSTGRVYHGKLGCDTGACAETYTLLRYSEDDGITWADCARPGPQINEDREWITVDNTPSSACYGTIYATWHASNSEKVARSTTNCASWSNFRPLTSNYQAISPDIKTAADGHAYVVWKNYGTNQFRLAGSSDCGITWTAPSSATVIKPLYGRNGSIPSQCQRQARATPMVDVDRSPDSPYFGRVYVAMFDFNQAGCGDTQGAWSCATWDANWTNTCNFDMYLTYSDDEGATWSTPVNLTEGDGNLVDHFMGYMRVDEADGGVYIGYHRSRLAPMILEDRQKTHFFLSRSLDGGQTWEDAYQASSLEGDQRVAGGNVFERGDYNGIDVYEGVVWPVWIDRRELTSTEEVVVRKVCSEPAHRSERGLAPTVPQVEVFGGSTVTITWTPPDLYWGDGGESPEMRRYQLVVDGVIENNNIPGTATSTTYEPGDTAIHSYWVRAANQCDVKKKYARRDFAACPNNPNAVDVTPDGPITVCTGGSQLLTATATGGTSLSYQWYRDGSPVGTDSPTYLAADAGTHTYNCVVTSSSCPGGVTDVAPTSVSWTQIPAFDGLQSAEGAPGSPCGIELAWNAVTPNCGGPVNYVIYRSATSGFNPGPSNRVVYGVTDTSYVDRSALSFNTEYFYIVRAKDNGVLEDNLVERSAAAIGDTTIVLSDDFEGADQGWVASLGTPAATQGGFIIGDPIGTTSNYGSPSQTEDDHTAGGVNCLYTAENPGANAGVNDIDSGEVVVTSPTFDGSAYTSLELDMWRWFFNEDSDDEGDYYVLEVSDDDGGSWAVIEELPGTVTNTNYWANVVAYLEDYVSLSSTMKIRVRAADGTAVGDLVEVAIDDVVIRGVYNCSLPIPLIFADGFESGDTTAW